MTADERQMLEVYPYLCRGCYGAVAPYRHQWAAPYCQQCVEEIEALEGALMVRPRSFWGPFFALGGLLFVIFVVIGLL